ncbi:MAG: N-acetylglutaminylglutamine amidotransferase [Burkholderiaceae bacterium]
MCGLVGSFHPNGSAANQDVIARMRDRMAHRGPDSAGFWREPQGRIALGHRRLSIIDLSEAAGQPMASPAGDVVVVFNGEIYNHAELRTQLREQGVLDWRTDHSDTEVIVNAYRQWGISFVDRLNGDFAIALFDRRDPARPEVHLVRDRAGVKPLYLTRTPRGEWLFASEIRALLAHPDVVPQMDRVAFWHYLTFIVAPAPLTLFKGIFKLPAGHRIRIDHEGRATAHRYWDCVPSARDTYREHELSYEEACTELLKQLRASIARRMVSDVPFGVLLSGGVDSSLNVALMSELMSRPVTTFTVGYETHEEFNEFDFARRVARRYRTEHHETRIDSREALAFLPQLVELQDEPIADNVCIPLYFLARLVRQSGTTVVQVGEGADENFLGYWWCEHYRHKHETVYAPVRRARRWGLFDSAEDRDIVRRARNGEQLFWGGAVCWWGELREKLTPDRGPFADEIVCPVDGLVPAGTRLLDSHAVVNEYLGGLTGNLAEPEILQKIPYMELKLRLPEHLLMRVDKMTMAHSVEARVPFLDHEVIDFARRLPPAYKLAEGIGKKLLKRIAEPYVDRDLLYRRKQGFGAPMDKWFTEREFGRACLAAFDRSALVKEGFFDTAYARTLLEDQVAGRRNWGFHMWTLMNAIFWHERWIG